MRTSFPLYKQLDAMDCGPTCLRMVAKYYGRSISLDYLRNKSQYGKEGVSMLGLADAAESIDLKSIGAKLTLEQLINDAPLPANHLLGKYFSNTLFISLPHKKLNNGKTAGNR